MPEDCLTYMLHRACVRAGFDFGLCEDEPELPSHYTHTEDDERDTLARYARIARLGADD